MHHINKIVEVSGDGREISVLGYHGCNVTGCGKTIFVRIASDPGILLENVQMILCVTTVGKLGTWLLTVLQKQCAGTAKNQGIYLQNARTNLSAIHVGRWVTWLVNVQNQAILEFAATVSIQAIWL